MHNEHALSAMARNARVRAQNLRFYAEGVYSCGPCPISIGEEIVKLEAQADAWEQAIVVIQVKQE